MKRITAILLSILCVLPLFSCAADPVTDAETSADTTVAETTAAETTAEETTEKDPILKDSLGTYDFDGAECLIFGASNRATKAVTAAEQNGETINDAQYKARTLVEERFDVKVRYEDIGTTDTDVANMMKQLVNGGDDRYAIGVGQDGNTIKLSIQGYHYNLKNMKQLDFEQPWWGTATKDLAVGEKYYAASSFLTYYCLNYARILVINKGLAADLNLTVPYDKVFNGTWYLDDFAQLVSAASSDVNGDGAMTEADRYGFAWVPNNLYTFQNSAGITAIRKDANNMPYIDFDLEAALKYLSVMEPLLAKHALSYKDKNATPFFANGGSLMVYCLLQYVRDVIRDSDVSYGFLPAPKLDENQKEYKTVVTDILWAVPAIHDKKLEMIGVVAEALSCQNYNYVRPAFFENTMKGKLSDSPEDAAVLDIIPATRTIDFGYNYYQVLTPIKELRDLTHTAKTDSLASTWKAQSSSLETYLKDLLTTIEKLPG